MWFPTYILQTSAEALSLAHMSLKIQISFSPMDPWQQPKWRLKLWKGGKEKLKVRRNYCLLLTTGPHGHPTARTNHLTFHILVSPALGSMPLCRVATYAVRTEEFLHLRRLGQVKLNPYPCPYIVKQPSVCFLVYLFFFSRKKKEKKNKQDPNKKK